VTAVDTSIVVPALLGWHQHHDRCRKAAAGSVIPSHVGIEAYSVLTRLPSPHRVAPDVAGALLESWFGRRRLTATARLQRELVERVSELHIAGGAVYDALVGLTASAAGETLLSRDQWAARTYEALEVPFELLS
jgi:predicted nucleic acid-binding protein